MVSSDISTSGISFSDRAVAEIEGRTCTPDRFRDVVESCRPAVLRGLVAEWPAVRAAATSTDLRRYLKAFGGGGRMEVFVGAPEIAGRYHYGSDLQGFNFERRTMGLAEALDLIVAGASATAPVPSVYAGSLGLDEHLPGFAADNPLAVIPSTVAGRIWLGNASTVSMHYDAFENLACVIAGTRRFTLFPPAAVADLYVGPIDHTLSGQPISLAASAEAGVDAVRMFPRFQAIRDQALTVTLAPGDALFLPKLWWHQVEATAPVNGLVNYWWDAFAAGPDAPYTALLLSLITVAERPLAERLAWRAFFDHYVFRPDGHPLAHLPADRHGVLGPLHPTNYGRIRARIMRLLRGG